MSKITSLQLVKLSTVVDHLGGTKARIADLKKEENADKEMLVSAASCMPETPVTFDGKLFRAVISFPDGRQTTDWEALARDLMFRAIGMSDEEGTANIAAFTTVGPVSPTVRVIARKSSD